MRGLATATCSLCGSIHSLSVCAPTDKELDVGRVKKRWERGESDGGDGVIRPHRITQPYILIRDNSHMTYLPLC